MLPVSSHWIPGGQCLEIKNRKTMPKILNAWNSWKHMIFPQDSYIKGYDLEQENLFYILMSENNTAFT